MLTLLFLLTCVQEFRYAQCPVKVQNWFRKKPFIFCVFAIVIFKLVPVVQNFVLSPTKGSMIAIGRMIPLKTVPTEPPLNPVDSDHHYFFHFISGLGEAVTTLHHCCLLTTDRRGGPFVNIEITRQAYLCDSVA